MKIKIKASTTPEAKTRLMKTPLGPKYRMMGVSDARGITPSDSMDSVANGWIPGSAAVPDMYGDEENDEEIGPSETVMVSVR